MPVKVSFFNAFRKAALVFLLVHLFFQILFPVLGQSSILRDLIVTGTEKYTDYMLSGVSKKLEQAKKNDLKSNANPFFSKQTGVFFFHNLMVMLFLFLAPHFYLWISFILPPSAQKAEEGAGGRYAWYERPLVWIRYLIVVPFELCWRISGISVNRKILYDPSSVTTLKEEQEYIFMYFPIFIFTFSTCLLAAIISYLQMVSPAQAGWFRYINMINLMIWHGTFELTALIMVPSFYLYTWDRIYPEIDPDRPDMKSRKDIRDAYTGYLKTLKKQAGFMASFLVVLVLLVYAAAIIEAHWTEKIAIKVLNKLDSRFSIPGLSYLLHLHYMDSNDMKSYAHYKKYLSLTDPAPDRLKLINKAFSLNLPELCLSELDKLSDLEKKDHVLRIDQIRMVCLIDRKRDDEALAIAGKNAWDDLARGLISHRDGEKDKAAGYFSNVTGDQCHAINFKWVEKIRKK